MFTHTPTTHEIVLAAAFVIAGSVAGIGTRTALRSILSRRGRGPGAGRQGWVWLLLGAVDTTAFWWLLAAGVWGAVLTLPVSGRVADALGDVVLAWVILTGTLAVARIVGSFTQMQAMRHHAVLGSSTIFVNIARLLVFILGALVVLQTMGVSIAPLLTALGVGGLAVALALQDTLSNLFAGLHVLASKKVVPGDYIRLDSNEEGYVIDINWRNTALRTIYNNVILIPNARLASAVVTNYYKPYPEMSVIVEVGVSYDSQLEQVERVTIDVARQTQAQVEGAVKDYEPIMRYRAFGESSVDFDIHLRVCEPTAQYGVTHEFMKRLHERYAREGIEIPFPIRTIVLPKGGSGGYPVVVREPEETGAPRA